MKRRHYRKPKQRHNHRHLRRPTTPQRSITDVRRRDIAFLQRSRVLQDILGFSSDNMTDMFQDGLQFLQFHNYNEALKVFSLLIRVNPYIADFWVAQGIVYQGKEDPKSALSSFLMAQTLNPAQFDGYLNAIECCLELKDYAQAQAIIKQGLRFAKGHPKTEGLIPFLEEMQGMQQRILDENE